MTIKNSKKKEDGGLLYLFFLWCFCVIFFVILHKRRYLEYKFYRTVGKDYLMKSAQNGEQNGKYKENKERTGGCQG